MAPARDRGTSPDEDQLLRFVERFGLLLSESGMPRMPARVFAFVLADDADRYTAKELAAGLRVSPAAISGAVRYLVQTGMLGKEREPGARTDTYRIYDDDIWSAIFAQQGRAFGYWDTAMAEGLELLPRDSAGARRLHETRAFMLYMQRELDEVMKRWPEHREKLLAETAQD